MRHLSGEDVVGIFRRFLQLISRLVDEALHLPHRLFHYLVHFALHRAADVADLAVDLSRPTHRARQLLGAKHDQAEHGDEDELRARQVEHGSKPTRSSNFGFCRRVGS